MMNSEGIKAVVMTALIMGNAGGRRRDGNEVNPSPLRETQENEMRTVMIAACAVLMSSCAPAYAQVECGPVDSMTRQLEHRFGETSRGYGLSGPVVVEVFANLETGTWTIVTHRPDGLTCAVAHGTDWDEPREAPADTDPAT